jgi:predicted ATP-grasp superfamily ATP-dependent carboligase
MEISTNELSKRIYILRGVQVMLDSDLAEIYGVETKRLKEAVKRNIKRFPGDFMFEPTLQS